jgi:hypothetical protein
MSEFDKLKDEGEQYAKDHPEQVKKGEQAAEKKLGLPGEGGNQTGQGGQDQAQQGQGQQDQAQQGQAQQGQGSATQDDQNSGGQGQ